VEEVVLGDDEGCKLLQGKRVWAGSESAEGRREMEILGLTSVAVLGKSALG